MATHATVLDDGLPPCACHTPTWHPVDVLEPVSTQCLEAEKPTVHTVTGVAPNGSGYVKSAEL